MTLSKQKLQDALKALAEEPGEDREACAQKWADAIGDYFAGVQLAPAGAPAPNGGSVTVSAATLALRSALVGVFGKGYDKAAIASGMESALAAFAATIAGGMAPLYTAVAPVGQVGFSQHFSPPYERTHALAAAKIASAVHLWALTGTATLTAPPKTPATWI